MIPEDEGKAPGLSRPGLVSAALGLIQEEGLDELSMRGLADRLHVKAASLYWHVRDRRELVELLADSILGRIPLSRAGAWRRAVLDTAIALRDAVASQRDADRILLEVPEALPRSEPFKLIMRRLQDEGLHAQESTDVALMAMVHVISAGAASGEFPMPDSSAIASIAIDSGSRGVVLRHGADMQTLISVPHDPAVAAPAVVQGATVKVRRLRGVGRGDIELNRRHPWRFQIQGPTWNTVLDVGSIDVRHIKLDSGATKVECILPRPRGVVPIVVSGGVVGLNLHRPPGVAVVADISSGAVRVKLDAFSANAVVTDIHWESEGASRSANRYELRISGGAVQVTLDDKATAVPAPRVKPELAPEGEPASALDILLDGVESRTTSRDRWPSP